MAGWKGFLPTIKVLSTIEACALPAGRASFQPARYMYLVDWKENLPAT
jgi:hypothetical protein